MFEIEDISLVDRAAKHKRNGLTDALFSLKVGQSFFADGKNYAQVYQCVKWAQRRKNSPLDGNFRIVSEGAGVRVGRIS